MSHGSNQLKDHFKVLFIWLLLVVLMLLILTGIILHITCVSYYLSLLKLTRSVKSVPISGLASGLMRSSVAPPDLDEQALEFFKFFRSTLNATVADQFNVSDINRIISHSRNMQR